MRPSATFGWRLVLGVGLLVGGLATVASNLVGLADRWMGPTGERLLAVSATVGLPTALCLLASVLVFLWDGRQRIRSLARWLAGGVGVVLVGLTATGVAGSINLALPHHARSPVLKAIDAASYAVGSLTILAVAVAFLVLCLVDYGEGV